MKKKKVQKMGRMSRGYEKGEMGFRIAQHSTYGFKSMLQTSLPVKVKITGLRGDASQDIVDFFDLTSINYPVYGLVTSANDGEGDRIVILENLDKLSLGLFTFETIPA